MKTAVCICTPMPTIPAPDGGRRLEPVTVEWHRARLSLGRPTCFTYTEIVIDNHEVGDARCKAVELLLSAKEKPEFLFFLDYDVLVPHDALIKLFYRARCFPDYDIFAGVYCCKGNLPEPLIYRGFGEGPYWDWAIGDLIKEGITGCHMGLTLIRTSLFERMDHGPSNPLFKTLRDQEMVNGELRIKSSTEDLYFCDRAIKEVGAKILVDTSVLAGHVQNTTGVVYGLPTDSPPVKNSHFINRDKKKEEDGEEEELKRALDIGAGESRRIWEGYKTYTTDIRKDSGADYVMDTRMLNFPEGEFDLVASCHHLEHIPRWEQETVWKEMARILKPGGKMEHIIPNLEWAAISIANGDPDEHVFNVLYGSQEQMGCDREFNTHFFGFTPNIARAMAEEMAGLEDVEIKTFKDDPDLGYNMVVTGVKPKVEEETAAQEEKIEEGKAEFLTTVENINELVTSGPICTT